jgi:hypothetical protein
LPSCARRPARSEGARSHRGHEGSDGGPFVFKTEEGAKLMCLTMSPLELRWIDGYRWLVVHEFYLRIDGEEYVVPAGYVTDGVSDPWLFRRVVPKLGPHLPAAVVHDYLYDQATTTKAKADWVFLQILKELGIPLWQRWPMWLAVRLFGRGKWKLFTKRRHDRNNGRLP